MHRKHYIHNGVRASRILVNGNGTCMLSGLKYALPLVRNTRIYDTLFDYPNNARPNLKWMSPELLEQNLAGFTCQSDVYSVGITCCELANGCPPFLDVQPTEMLLDKLTANCPKPLDSTCAELEHLSIVGELVDLISLGLPSASSTFSTQEFCWTPFTRRDAGRGAREVPRIQVAHLPEQLPRVRHPLPGDRPEPQVSSGFTSGRCASSVRRSVR